MRYTGRPFLTVLLSCSILALQATASGAKALTIGADTGNTCYPFSCFAGATSPAAGTTYQEVYASAAFSGSITVDTATFFQWAAGPIDSATYDISFYYAANSFGSQSTTLSDNLGSLLSDWGNFTLSGNLPTTLTFQGAAFTYDPSVADLLMQVSVIGVTDPAGANSTNPGYLQADYSGGSLVSDSVGFSDPTYNSANSGGGLVTQFSRSSVPEPSGLALFGVGLVAISFIHRRRRPRLV